GAPQEAVRYPIQDATVSVGNNPMQTIDGNLGTRWSTEGKQWIEYDLGQVQEVYAVSIAMPWGDQQKYLIDLEVSEDNVNWQNVWNGKSSGTSDKMETYLFDRVPARYVRINVNGNHINTTNNISEVAIYNIEETELQPQVTLVGSGEVMGGEVFDVNIEINGLERLVYAQDLMINYDTKVFELIGVEGIDPSIIVHQEENEEGLRLMIATEGGLASGKDAVILLFRARDVSQESEGEVVITTAELGVVKEGIAEIVRPEKSKVNIKVKPNTSTEVDKAILMSTIAVAEELSNNANIGNDIGQYPQEEKDKLDQAIIVAKQIAKDSVNQVEIDGATRTLLEGINEFKASQIVSASEDVNKDNAVNVADLALVAYYYTATPESDNWKEANRADINKDNRVDVGDLARVASRILEK
ncbi:MAG: discoidin domain-containing protein, partial [Niameybacter sp.]